MDATQRRTIDHVRQIVCTIVAEKGLTDPEALRVALFDAYPYEERKGYRYHAWLSAIKEEIGGMRPAKPDPRQLPLFN